MGRGRVKFAEGMIRAKNYGPAIQVLRQHLGTTPNDPQGQYLLGLAAYRSGDDATAESAFRALVATSPTNVPALYNLALTVARGGRIDEARQLLTKAIQTDPTYQPARERLAALEEAASTRERGRTGERDRLSPGERLRSGSRRVSSYAGRFALATLMLTGGAAILLTSSPGRLRWLAELLTFPSPAYFQEQLERLRGTPIEAQVQRELDTAMTSATQTSARLDVALIVVAIALLALGGGLLLHGLLAASRTRYDVFERRIDIVTGLMNRSRRSVWLYEITDVQVRQPFWLTMTGNAEIRIKLEDNSQVSLTGFGNEQAQLSLWEELRDAALVERRALKNVWI